MTSLSRLFIRDRETPSSRVRIRHELAVPANSDGSNGDVCIVADGASAGVYIHTAGAWTEIGSGSSTSIGYYDPMAAPSSPNARDDEFSALSGWTTWNAGSLAGFTATASSSQLKLTTTSQNSGANILAGIFKACPTGADWSAWTKVCVTGNPSSGLVAPYGGGLILATADIDSNPSTADVYTLNFYTRLNGNTSILYGQTWTAYNAVSGSPLALDLGDTPTSIWLRVRWANASTTLSFDLSTDGVGWRQAYSTASPFLTPARIGFNVIAAMSASDPSPVVSADFLRFSSSAALSAETLGKVI